MTTFPAVLPTPAKSFYRITVLTSLLGLALAGFITAQLQVAERGNFVRSAEQIKVVAPATAPDVSQASIDLALVMFGISVPTSADHPVLDLGLADRGLTTRGALMVKAKVAVGPAAFSSWGLLGSTLAHELEVHCQQNFLIIYLMDTVGLDGTGAAERQAYVHELRNAHRFGLDVADAQMIADTMDYYYPDNVKGPGLAVPRTVRSWLARNVLRGPRAN